MLVNVTSLSSFSIFWLTHSQCVSSTCRSRSATASRPHAQCISQAPFPPPRRCPEVDTDRLVFKQICHHWSTQTEPATKTEQKPASKTNTANRHLPLPSPTYIRGAFRCVLCRTVVLTLRLSKPYRIPGYARYLSLSDAYSTSTGDRRHEKNTA